jgi:hypothetical protein
LDGGIGDGTKDAFARFDVDASAVVSFDPLVTFLDLVLERLGSFGRRIDESRFEGKVRVSEILVDRVHPSVPNDDPLQGRGDDVGI